MLKAMNLPVKDEVAEAGDCSAGNTNSRHPIEEKIKIPEISENREFKVGDYKKSSLLHGNTACTSLSVMKEICMINDEINELFDGISCTSTLPNFNSESAAPVEKSITWGPFQREQGVIIGKEKKVVDDFTGIQNESKTEYNCEVCRTLFPSEKELQLHVREAPTKTFFICLQCEMYFCAEFRLKDHVQIDHGNFTFALEFGKMQVERKFHKTRHCCYCEICENYQGSDERLAKHLNKYHKGDHNVIRSLANHNLIVLDAESSRSHQCDLCHRSFYCNRGLMIHQRRIHKIIPVELKTSLMLLENDVVDGNASNIEVSETGGYQCEICNKKFLNKAGLGMHRKTHSVKSRAEQEKEIDHSEIFVEAATRCPP